MICTRTLIFACSAALSVAACSSTPQESNVQRGGRTQPSPKPSNVAAGGAVANTGAAATSGSASQGSFLLTPSASVPGSGTAGTAPLRDGQCARQDVTTTRIIPTVWLVVDGSGSMVSLLDPMNMSSPSRWDALRSALMDPAAGLVKTLEHQVKFGMVMFDGPIPGNIPIALPDGGVAMFSSGPAMTCPRLVDVEPALDNFAAIDMAYTKDPLGGSTPTDKALEQVVKHLPDSSQAGPDDMIQPTIVVLATDGEPNDFCSMTFPPANVQPKVIDAVKQLVTNGNKTYVISLAGSDTNLMQFCTQVAAAGGTGKPAYVPSTRDALIQAFQEIIGPGVACDVHLDGMVKPGMECKGTVQLDGATLPCGSDNGWRLKDMSTLTITGSACETFKMNPKAYLHADFPCEAFQLN